MEIQYKGFIIDAEHNVKSQEGDILFTAKSLRGAQVAASKRARDVLVQRMHGGVR